MIKKMDCVAIPVKSDELDKAVAFYRSLGLEKSWELKRNIGNDVTMESM